MMEAGNAQPPGKGAYSSAPSAALASGPSPAGAEATVDGAWLRVTREGSTTCL